VYCTPFSQPPTTTPIIINNNNNYNKRTMMIIGASVKRSPQRWQDEPDQAIAKHNDVTICFEERIFDAVVEDLQMREPTEDFKPIHIICLDTKDNPHEAAKQGQVALDLCWQLEGAADDLTLKAADIVETFQTERMTHTPIKVLYQLCYL